MRAHVDHGRSLLDAGEYAAAAAEFRLALASRPDDPQLLSKLALSLAGQGLFGEAKEAADSASAAAARSTQRAARRRRTADYVTAVSAAVRCLAGEHEEALVIMHPVRQDYWYAHYWRAYALLHSGRPEEALAAAQECARRAPRPLRPPMSEHLSQLIADCERAVRGHLLAEARSTDQQAG